jgi:hypothetical protein
MRPDYADFRYPVCEYSKQKGAEGYLREAHVEPFYLQVYVRP